MEVNPFSLSASETNETQFLHIIHELGYKWYSEVSEPLNKISLDHISLKKILECHLIDKKCPVQRSYSQKMKDGY